MKITEINIITEYSIQTEGLEWNFHRRSMDSCNWETLMGDSWEPSPFEDELELEFKKEMEN